MNKKQTIKTESHLVTVETTISVKPRVLDYDDILDACSIEWDDDGEAPWDRCDGLEHEWRGTSYYGDDRAYQAHNYVNRPIREGGSGFIIINNKTLEKWGFTEQYRQSLGMAKQPFREMVQANKRRTIEQLVNWYEDGWQWFGVACRIKITEDGIEQCDYKQADYQNSLWGIDTEEYAEECKPTIAYEIVKQLENDGYEVINKPAPYDSHQAKLAGFRDKIKRQLQSA